jgi:hypothetical protein
MRFAALALAAAMTLEWPAPGIASPLLPLAWGAALDAARGVEPARWRYRGWGWGGFRRFDRLDPGEADGNARTGAPAPADQTGLVSELRRRRGWIDPPRSD